MIRDFYDLKFNDEAKEFSNMLIFVKMALSSSDYGAISDFWDPPSRPSCVNLSTE